MCVAGADPVVRILHLIQRYWPARGGAEIHFGEISAFLAAQGHQVTVVTTDALDFELFWDPRCRRVDRLEDTHQGVRILRFPVRPLPGRALTYSALRRLLWLLSFFSPLPASLLDRLSRATPHVPDLWRWLATTSERFDVVAGMNMCFEPVIAAGWRFAQRHSAPFVIYPLTHLGAGKKPAADALSRFYTMRHQLALAQRSAALVAQTPAERDFYVAHGVSSERILVAGPGVDPETILGGDGQGFRRRYGISETTPILFSLSALSYDKGSVHLVEALQHLWRAGRSPALILAGAVLQPFQVYLDRLPPEVRRRILVLGAIGDEEKRDLFAAGDIFAMPSRTDSFGIVYLEAWVCRKPVVGAQTWGVKDVIQDGRDGILVPFGDVPALTRALAFLLDYPAVRLEMAERGARKVQERHTWPHKHRLVHDLYRSLVASQSRPADVGAP